MSELPIIKIGDIIYENSYGNNNFLGDVFRLPNGRCVYTEKMLEKIRGLLK